ncbi:MULTISPECIES: hypothetical protein [Cellulomonas]|uniref:DUF3185 family protein n=1 Tax=Cellulomonas avistercoris TaxID=2762242 RepID=A0ABR8QHH8_9CELL|nr:MULTISPECIES: hypothetical protein [Cellulomonas]MBD7919894.1 hypothetical protein [Cellulomonas avistercoris]SFK12172.1 hypothetical protein SAMN05216467_2043 [Cellulomonas sp. KH9]
MSARHIPLALTLLGAALLLTAGSLFYFGFSAAEETLDLPYSPSPLQLVLGGLGVVSIVLGGVAAIRRAAAGTA